ADAFAGSRTETARPKVIAAARPVRAGAPVHGKGHDEAEAAEPAPAEKPAREADTPAQARAARPAALATSDSGDWSAF
ncbi:methyl-accepting chemotaxis protein, partial [Cupriavidus basilensis]|nr:methyl-accepting chemotaxis protein [Cupriavidus basilensis]